MIVPYFSVFDMKANLFGSVFASPTPGAAERALRESINNPDSPHAKFPEDYSLYQVFDFDDNQGIIVETYEPPRLICHASALITSRS